MSFLPQGTFRTPANASPEQIARKRELMALLRPRFGSAKYVGEGLGQLATGIMMGRENANLNRIEDTNRAQISALFNGMFSGNGRNVAASAGGGGRSAPGGTWTPGPPPPKPTDLPAGMGRTPMSFGILGANPEGLETVPADAMGAGGTVSPPGAPVPQGMPPVAAPSQPLSFGSAGMTPQEMLIEGAKARGLDPLDVATAISYETGGTFDPLIQGPTTQWGSHEGLIQFGDPQGQEHGAVFDQGPETAMRSQLDPQNGAVWSYLDGTGVQPGMGLLDIYSAINAGAPGRYGASDANNGGAPGNVGDKVAGMGAHREKAAAFLGGTWTPAEGGGNPASQGGGAPAQPGMGGPGFDIGTLAQIAYSPYADPGQKQVATILLQQQMQAMDPMARIEMQKAQIELAQMQNGGGNDAPAGYRELQMRALDAGLQPGSPEYQQFMLSGGGGIREGRPAAFEALHLQAIAGGLVEGSPEYQKWMRERGAFDASAARTLGTQVGEAQAGLGGAIAKGQQAIDLIDQIAGDPALPSITGMLQGNLPAMAAGQGGVDLNVKIKQLQGKVFLEAFESLKGGGAITEIEGTKAEAAMARLDRAQSTEAYQAALAELTGIIRVGMERAKAKAALGDAPASPAPAAGGDVLKWNPATGEFE